MAKKFACASLGVLYYCNDLFLRVPFACHGPLWEAHPNGPEFLATALRARYGIVAVAPVFIERAVRGRTGMSILYRKVAR